MNQNDYWQKVHLKYSQQDWSKHPNIFATELIKYLPKSGKILELAAGIGQDSRYFESLGYDVISSDLLPPSQIVDLNNPLPFSNNSFDVVYSHLGLHYFSIERTKELFREIYNILNVDGIFCGVFNSTTDPETKELKQINTDYYETPEGVAKRFFSPESLKGILPKEFKILLLDNNGKTIKDGDNPLVRLVCQK